MAFSKAPAFDHHSFLQAQWSRALAHPARIRILQHLNTHGITPFFELARLLPLHRSTVSQHLRTLRQLGVVTASERYPYTFYAIDRTFMAGMARRLYRLQGEFMTAAGQ